MEVPWGQAVKVMGCTVAGSWEHCLKTPPLLPNTCCVTKHSHSCTMHLLSFLLHPNKLAALAIPIIAATSIVSGLDFGPRIGIVNRIPNGINKCFVTCCAG